MSRIGPVVLRPYSLEEAIEFLSLYEGEAKAVGGSTAVTLMLRQRLIAPEALVSLSRLPGLNEIIQENDEIRIGALVHHREVELNSLVREQIPVLSKTFEVVANVRVRHAATVGGLLAEADYASDPPATFAALDARVEVSGPDGPHTVPIQDFFVGFYETVLEPDEIVTGVRIPIPQARTYAVYEKFKTRSSEDRPCLGVLAAVRLGENGKTCEDLRLAVGAAAETPQRFSEIEETAQGHELTEDVVGSVADQYAESIDSVEDLRGSAWYRTEMIRVWARRAIQRARDGEASPRGL